MMLCPSCNAEVPKGMRFCGGCGAELKSRCPKCGFESPPAFRFCGACGGPLSAADKGGAPRSASIGKAVGPAVVSSTARNPESEAAAPPDGERKTVTVLFADIKGSMELIEDLDPEEARAIVDPALKLMIDAVHRYDGLVAQSMGDGIFALFGAPIAHEDHPQRALYAALRMQEESRRYANRLRAEGKSPISIRVGVNTGEVVVRSVRKDADHSDYVPVGHSTGLAERMQALATPVSIAISEHTHKLVEGYFAFKALGPTRVKGLSEPINVYEVTGLGPLRTRLQRSMGRGPTKFVGRQPEMDSIARAAEPAKAGHGQIVAVAAEPGVGKSRLYYEFKVRNQSGWMVLEAFSVSFGKASAYLPVIDLLNSYFGIDIADDSRKRREKIAGRLSMLDPALDDARPYLFRLLGLVEGDDPLAQMDGQTRRRKTLDAIKRILIRESLNQPLMVIFEDLHWIDGETQALLDLLADSLVTAKILLLVNYRPEYRHEWGSKTSYTQLRLEPLGRESAAEMLTALLGDTTEVQPLRRLIMETTGGNPLFMEETIQALLEDGALVRNGQVKIAKPLNQLRIPPTVEAILASRIDRLPADEKQLLQTLAVIGRELPLRLIEGVLHPHPPDAASGGLSRKRAGEVSEDLERMLADLQLREFILEQLTADDIEYKFKHALTQEVAANSILIEKRKLLHERTAQAMESLYADRLDDHVDQLAHHYERSANTRQAVKYLHLAGQRAMQSSAHVEAISKLSLGLELLKSLPDTPERDRQELALQIAIEPPLLATKGYTAPEVENASRRALELCQRLGERPELFAVQSERVGLTMMRGKFRIAQGLAKDLLESAQRAHDPAQLLAAHFQMGMLSFWLGELALAGTHLEQAIAVYDSQQHRNLGGGVAGVLTYAAWALWYVGHPDQALARIQRALTLAHESANPLTLASVLSHSARLHVYRREPQIAQELAEAALAVTNAQGFAYWAAQSKAIRGWSLAQTGREAEGIAQLKEGLDGWRTTGGETLAELSCWLPQAYGKTGQSGEGLSALAEQLEPLHESSKRYVYVPELYRIKGELLLMRDSSNAIEAEACFRTALEIAQRQAAKSLELRATTSLARLLAQQGKRDEARAMLAEIYGWFTEGFDTADLKDAKALLDELSA